MLYSLPVLEVSIRLLLLNFTCCCFFHMKVDHKAMCAPFMIRIIFFYIFFISFT